jgi:hypothetical protein
LFVRIAHMIETLFGLAQEAFGLLEQQRARRGRAACSRG